MINNECLGVHNDVFNHLCFDSAHILTSSFLFFSSYLGLGWGLKVEGKLKNEFLCSFDFLCNCAQFLTVDGSHSAPFCVLMKHLSDMLVKALSLLLRHRVKNLREEFIKRCVGMYF